MPGKATQQTATKGGEAADQLLSSAIDILQNATDAHDLSSVVNQLNRYLERTPEAITPLDADTRSRLTRQFGEQFCATVDRKGDFDDSDTGYLRDAVFLYTIARSLQRDDEPAAQALRLLEWLDRNVQLSAVGRQAELPPTETCVQGLGDRNQRAWIFVELLRQSGLQGCLIALPGVKDPEEQQPWLCGVIDGTDIYLFEPELGFPIRSATGKIATLAELMANPKLIEAFQLDPAVPYRVRPEQVRDVSALVVLEPEMVAPRMEFLQKHLSGTNRANLAVDWAAAWSKVETALERIGGHRGVALWPYPQQVRARLRSSPEQRERLLRQMAMTWLIGGSRSRQLRGDHEAAVKEFVTLDAGEIEDLPEDRQQRLAQLPPPVRQLSVLAARRDLLYFVGLSKLGQSRPEPGVAAHWFQRYLDKFGDPLFRATDPIDVASLCTRLREESKRTEPNVGLRVWTLLPETSRADVAKLADRSIAAQRQAEKLQKEGKRAEAIAALGGAIDADTGKKVIGALAQLLRRKDFCEAGAFASVVPPDLLELASKPPHKRSETDAIRLNRALFFAAFPDVFLMDQTLWAPNAMRYRAVALHAAGKTAEAIKLAHVEHAAQIPGHRIALLRLIRDWETAGKP